MAFPEEAVYGPLKPQQQHYDKRDDTSSHDATPQTPNSDNNNNDTIDDDYEDLVHIASRDEDGNPCAEIEVTRTITNIKSRLSAASSNASMVDRHLGRNNNSNSNISKSKSFMNQEELSPHIDTNIIMDAAVPPLVAISTSNQSSSSSPIKSPHNTTNTAAAPQLPLSPTASLLTATTTTTPSSFQQQQLEYETNTVKQHLIKLQSSRDRYRNERNTLQSQLTVSESRRIHEVQSVQLELETLRNKAENQIELLLEDLKCSKVHLQQLLLMQSQGGTNNSNGGNSGGGGGGNEEEVQRQLQELKKKLLTAQEALNTEKSSSLLRQATKVEEARQAALEEFQRQMKGLEQSYQSDLTNVRTEKEEEVRALQEELVTCRGIQEQLASQINGRDEELNKVKGLLEQLSREHENCPTVEETELKIQSVREEMDQVLLKRVTEEKEGLAGQLEQKHVELMTLKGEYTNEYDRMKDQLSNMTELAEERSVEVTRVHEKCTGLQRELCASKLETTRAMEQITTLSQENFELREQVEGMGVTRRQYELEEEERRVEVMRLHAKLEEIHSLVPMLSQDSSKDGGGGGVATVPELNDGAESSTGVVVACGSNGNEVEATLRHQLKIAQVERDIVKTQLEDMKKTSSPPPPPPTAVIESSTTVVADLKDKLEKAEKLYIDVAVENNELKAQLGSPKISSTLSKDGIASELKSVKATLLIKNAEIATLKRQVLLKENQQVQHVMSANDTTEDEGTKLKNQVVGEIASLVADHPQQQPPASIPDPTDEIAADVPAGIILGNDIDDIKHEHRVEVKHLMEKHASLKTQVQLLTKQKEQIANAYEIEQNCSAELESSLQEIVALLEAERSMHSGKLNELKVIKHKFSKLRKKRVPVDAAYKASLMLLEQLERKKIASKSNRDIEEVMTAAIDLINELTHDVVVSEAASEKLKRTTLSSLSDDEQANALSEACDKLEVAVSNIKKQLSFKSIEYDKLLKSKEGDDVMHQEAVAVLKQQLVDFSDSATKFEETVANYKNLLGEAEEKNGILQEQIRALEESSLARDNEKQLASAITLEIAQQERDVFKQQLEAAETKCESLEVQKAELVDEVSRLEAAETKCESLEVQKAELVNEVSRAKRSSGNLRKEKEMLSDQLEHAETRVEELLGLIQELRDTQLLNGDAKKTANEMHDLAEKYESLQAENKKLVDEAAHAKESFEKVLAEFEQTLTVTCESHEKALREKQEECKGLNEQLDRVTISLQTATVERNNPESSKEIALVDKARKDLSAAKRSNDKEAVNTSRRELDVQLRQLEKNLLADAIKQEVIQQENDSLKQQIQEAAVKVQSLEEERNKLVGDVNRAKESFQQVIIEFEQELKATCDVSEQALREKEEECKNLIEQLDRLKEELSDSKETSLQEITRLTDMASKDRTSLEELQTALEISKEDVERSKKALEELREELADSEESERALQDVVGIHQSSIATLKEDLQAATARVEEMKKFVDQVESSKSESQGKFDKIKKELEDTKKSLKDSVEVCMQLRTEIGQKDALARENKILTEKIQSLSNANANLESEAATHDQAISMIEHELKTTRTEITLKNRQIQVAQDEKENTKRELDMAIKSMEEVVGSLQEQIKSVESEKDMNRSMYEQDIQLQQQEVEALQKKYSAAMCDLDSLSELISTLKDSLESEKENGKNLFAQFNKSEEERKAYLAQKQELEEELAATLRSVDVLTEQISCLEADLAVAISEEEERELKDKLSSQEEELHELRAKVDSIEASRKNLQDEFKDSLHKKEEESTKLRVILQEAKDKLFRLQKENEKLQSENSDALNSMSTMLQDAVKGRAEADMSLQESIHLLEKQKRMDIKKNSQISKLEHEVQILQTKERYQETLIASLKNQIKRGM